MKKDSLRDYKIALLLCCIFSGAAYANATQQQQKILQKQIVKNKVSKTATANKTTQFVNQALPKTNRVLVKYKESKISTLSASINKKIGGTILRSFKSVKGLNLIKLADGVNLDQALQDYRNDPQVVYAEPDFPLEMRLTAPELPDDTEFSNLWALHNTGQTTTTSGTGTVDADINALEAWYITTGSPNVVVAIIDTGVDYSHIELKENMWVNPNEIPENGIDDDGNGYIDDVHGIDVADSDSDPMDSIGHGTHIAGTIAAKGNNTLGVTGVNWDAKVIACKIFSETELMGINGVVSSAIECLEYLYDLKTQHGIDIVATNNSWGWQGLPSQALKEAMRKHAEAGILFVASAGNNFSDNDFLADNPSSYYLPNVISVAATDNTDNKAFFTNYGRRSVHVGAPGLDILSTIPGNDSLIQNPLNSTNSIFFDDAEAITNSWVAEPPWALTSTFAFSGTQSWTDSPIGNYVDDVNVSLISPIIDLSLNSSQDLYLTYMSRYDIENGFDQLLVEYTNDGGQTWLPAGSQTGLNLAWNLSYFKVPALFRNNQFQFRFRLTSDSTINYDGVYIDDIGVGEIPANVDLSSNKYASFSGTSMSSPHVVGLLALLKAQDPSRNWQQLKNLLLSGGTPIPALEGDTVTGRRIRAADSDGTGALTCTNQSVLSRLMPIADKVVIKKGTPVELSVINILCDQPAGQITATISGNSEQISLQDNGSGFDFAAEDGIYSAQINLSQSGMDNTNISIHNPNNPAEIIDSIDVVAVSPYLQAESTYYKWRDFGGNENLMDINQDLLNFFTAPFPIHFSDKEQGFSFVGVSASGYLTLTNSHDESLPIVSISDGLLPYALYSQFFDLENIIAPFWDNLFLVRGGIYWGVIGQAPNRELIVEWRDVTHFEVGGEVSFQVVFSENNSEIIFNYKDAEFGNVLHDYAVGALVGVQSSHDFAQVHRVFPSTIQNASALIWRTSEADANKASGGSNDSGGGSMNLLVLSILTLMIFGYGFSRHLKTSNSQKVSASRKKSPLN